MTIRLLFKVLNEDGSCCHGGRGRWPLPTDGKPGAALTVTGPLDPCANGLHLCEPDDLLFWLGSAIWLAQVPDGVEEKRAEHKVVVRTARLERRLLTWNERTARLFACDCAERVVHLSGDPRVIAAIATARRYAEGTASRTELTAARAAAGAAGDAAAGAAGDAAAWAAAAWAAARAAAWDFAAWDAARDAEHTWQTQRLLQYLRGEVG